MKVLVATDGSDYSNYAVEEFCRIFPWRSGVDEIKVVSVYEEHFMPAVEPFSVPAEYYQQIVDAAKTQAGQFSAVAAGVLRECFGGPDPTVEIMNGPPEKEIVELAEAWRADLVVVGSHGRGIFGRMIGSVSDAVLHHAPCSVLVVRRPKGKRGTNA